MMEKSSRGIITAVAGALGALVLALPLQSSADWNGYRGDSYQWRPAYPQSQRYLDYDDFGHPYYRDYREPYYGYGQRQQWNAWQRLQHERQEMAEARREGDWNRYRHEKREAEEAARALQHQHHDWDD